jgi:hypothetical protein
MKRQLGQDIHDQNPSRTNHFVKKFTEILCLLHIQVLKQQKPCRKWFQNYGFKIKLVILLFHTIGSLEITV